MHMLRLLPSAEVNTPIHSQDHVARAPHWLCTPGVAGGTGQYRKRGLQNPVMSDDGVVRYHEGIYLDDKLWKCTVTI